MEVCGRHAHTSISIFRLTILLLPFLKIIIQIIEIRQAKFLSKITHENQMIRRNFAADFENALN